MVTAQNESTAIEETDASNTAPAAPVAVAHGDGIGPEIMRATLTVLEAAGANIETHPVELGESVFRRGHSSGIAPEAWETLRTHRTLLKAPITTPQGGGVKSVNVTLRKTLGLFANIRPCVAYDPFIPVRHPHLDVVIVRENEEDLYAGIEHQQTDDVVQCLKLITRPGCERIVRYAFEYARRRDRRKVTCFVKDNIMKLTDGLFRRVFEEVAAEYPDIESDHLIVDIGMGRLANAPELFDIIVTPNLYGDILSDVAAEISGSVGLAPSANIGDDFAMFEAIHGSAPDIAGQDVANPSGLLLSAAKMLAHLGQGETATAIHNAWLCTIEDGVHTADIFRPRASRQRVGTQDFAGAVIERLGRTPHRLKAAEYAADAMPRMTPTPRSPAKKDLLGVDVFLHWQPGQPVDLAERLGSATEGASLRLEMITNRGVKVWPEGLPETFLTDHWRCRFQAPGATSTLDNRAVLDLLGRIEDAGLDFVKTEHLYAFDGVPAFSLGQGQ
jgi:isocitrate dehydrogenase